MRPEERLIVALDTGEREQALALVDRLGGRAKFFKVAVGLFTSAGPELIGELTARDKKVFVDLKFHDIPTQVATASRAVVRLGASMMNLHVMGGREMMTAAMEAVKEESAALGVPRPLVVGVTVLTSLDALEGAWGQVPGSDSYVEEMVITFARLAREAGLDGVVCSGREVRAVRSAVGSECVTVVPGIRPAGEESGDQRRVFTPGRARADGADYLVVGRPITSARDPEGALERILEEMQHASPA